MTAPKPLFGPTHEARGAHNVTNGTTYRTVAAFRRLPDTQAFAQPAYIHRMPSHQAGGGRIGRRFLWSTIPHEQYLGKVYPWDATPFPCPFAAVDTAMYEVERCVCLGTVYCVIWSRTQTGA